MSRNSENATRKAQAKVITAMHQRGEKGATRTGTTKKQNAWWQTGDFLAWIAAMLVNGAYISPTAFAAMAAALLMFASGIISVAGLYYLRTETSLKNVHAPGFVREAYTSWKDKTCVKGKLK